MSTRCGVEIYHKMYPLKDYVLGARLYHHSDGYPTFMFGKLAAFVNKAKEVVNKANISLSAETLAGAIIAISGQNYEKPERPNKYKMPYFQPCLENRGDLAFLYKVYIDSYGYIFINYEKL